ncbi:MAG: tRNA pseudouridine(55) synthase TruB [Rickettsiales bacterium]|nr:tRNA pseudouridine(55) synthase TruB [Rickettsiales bacterium]
MTKNNQPINGWIILDKPSGISSAYAVGKVKRLLRPKKIGHAGTLDPLASGILPLALGEATKTVSYMMDARKSYQFTVTWGAQYDTDDCNGEPIEQSNQRPTREAIEAILPRFSGSIEQIPPLYSAIKVNGKRAYALARAGELPELKSRQITVYSLRITDHHIDKTTFICDCSKGTYIRSLARDMGQILGCFGHITALRRLQVGHFLEKDAISLENLEEMVHKGGGFLQPVDSALDDILAFEITHHQATLLRQGQAISVTNLGSYDAALARCDNEPIALCQLLEGVVKPLRVFNLP